MRNPLTGDKAAKDILRFVLEGIVRKQIKNKANDKIC